MNRVGAFLLGGSDDSLDIEVGFDRAFPFANQVGLVRLETVQAKPILFRVNSDGTQAEFVRGAEDANGDLTAVCSQQLLDGSLVGHSVGLGDSVESYIFSRVTRRTNWKFLSDGTKSRMGGTSILESGRSSRKQRFYRRGAEGAEKATAKALRR